MIKKSRERRGNYYLPVLIHLAQSSHSLKLLAHASSQLVYEGAISMYSIALLLYSIFNYEFLEAITLLFFNLCKKNSYMI